MIAAMVSAISIGTLCICASGQEADTNESVEPVITDNIYTETSAAFSASTSLSESETTVIQTDSVGSETTDISDPQIENGWNLINNRWFYYSDGIPVSGTVEIDGENYLFAPNGVLQTGWQTVKSLRKFFDYETGKPVYGWVSDRDRLYYCTPESGKLVGMQEIEGEKYIFDNHGILQYGFVNHNGYFYYCTENGKVLMGDYKKTPIEINGVYYIISPVGHIQLGWQTINKLRIYYDYETAQPVYGWIKYNDRYYYADSQSGKYTGDKYIDNRPYRFGANGILQTGLQAFKDGNVCYYFEDGTWAVGFRTIDKSTYYFDKNGFMVRNWQTVNKKKYYFGSDGKMVTGLVKIDGEQYYFNDKGAMQTGFQKIGSNTYYFSSAGKMCYNWQTIDKNKYYLGSDGKMRTGWQTISKKKYYFASDGKMKTGWQTISKNKYYFNSDGVMQTGMQIIDGKYCNLGNDGILKPIKVFVGVGHGGYDPGAVSYIVEKEYTLKVGKLVAEHLKNAGIEYLMSRDADIDTTMLSKLELCNNYNPDLIIDIHFNAGSGHGFEVYHSMYGGMSKTLAENINAEVSKIMYSNGCKTFINAEGKDRFTIIRETHVPSVLCEGGFVDDWSDAEWIKSNYQKLAKAYAEGVLKTILMLFKN